MNQCFLIGRLTRQPELRSTTSGVSVCRFSIAVQRRGKKDEADFLNIVTWRGLADLCAKYLVKGQQVAVSGEIRANTYEGRDGQKRVQTEIQADDVLFLGKPVAGKAEESAEFAAEIGELFGDDELPY